ncbi:MAG: polymer-forming cytoskeletal protein [Bacteroidales bacterium]|nr:polymer-forming cytoskeletal protein [Bacteroidales bacterium]
MSDIDVSQVSGGSVFNGRITSEGPVRIDGKFDGSLLSKGQLTVGENARVKGNLICENGQVSGLMESGSLVAKKTLVLTSSSVVEEGDISFGQIQVDLGAKIAGAFHVLTAEKQVSESVNE